MTARTPSSLVPFAAQSRLEPLPYSTPAKITSGTPSVMRKAEELSTTVQPAAEEMGAYFLEMEPPALNRAMSRPSKLQGQWSRVWGVAARGWWVVDWWRRVWLSYCRQITLAAISCSPPTIHPPQPNSQAAPTPAPLVGQRLHGVLVALKSVLAPRGALRGQHHDVAVREVALVQDAQELLADGAYTGQVAGGRWQGGGRVLWGPAGV